MAKANGKSMEKEEQTGKQGVHKQQNPAQRRRRSYLMLGLSLVLVAIGIYFLVSLAITVINKHKFEAAAAEGDTEQATRYAVKVAHNYQKAEEYLDALDLRRDFQNEYRRARGIVGHNKATDWGRIQKGHREVRASFGKERYAEAAELWAELTNLCKSMRQENVRAEFRTEPPVAGALLTVGVSAGDEFVQEPIEREAGTELRLYPGEYALSIVHTNHTEWTTNMVFAATADEPIEVVADLPPLRGSILIECDPPATI